MKAVVVYLLALFAVKYDASLAQPDPTIDAVTVTVSPNGVDNSTCLTGHSINCHTLGYALSNASNNMMISVLYSHNLTSMVHLQSLTNLTVMGVAITITCPKLGCGISIENSTNITFYGILWVDCSIEHPTTAVGTWSCTGCTNLINPKAYSALFISNCTNVTIDCNNFTSVRGSGVSLYNVRGVVNVTNSVFYNHSLLGVSRCTDVHVHSNSSCSPQATGLYIEFSYCNEFTSDCYPDHSYFNGSRIFYHIWNCTFQGNRNSGAYRPFTDIVPSRGVRTVEQWPFGRGGGLGVVLRAYKIEHLHLSVYNCQFIKNSAIFGGGIYLELESGHPNHNYFNLWSNRYHGNTAELNGGAVEIVTDLLYETSVHSVVLNESMHNYFYLLDNSFEENEAYWGGGLSVVAYPTNIHYLSFVVTESCWYMNKYSGGAGSVGLLRKDKPDRFYWLIASVTFVDCQFNSTRSRLAKGVSQAYVSGSFYSEGINVTFCGSTFFSDNTASALALSDTGVTFRDNVTFERNVGFNGGAILLSGKAWITLTENVRVQFIHNSAYEYGGAIYYVPPAPLNMKTSESCFVWYEAVGNIDVPIQYWEVNVTFVGNVAYQSGDAAYVSNPQQCAWPNQTSIFNKYRTEKFNYELQRGDSADVIATPPINMTITVHGADFIHSAFPEIFSSYSMMPGEKLDVEIETFDTLGNRVPGTFAIKTYRIEDYNNYNLSLDLCSGKSEQDVCSLSTTLLTSNINVEDLTITGPENESILLVFKSNNPVTIVLPLQVNLSSCTLGFRYNSGTKSCECVRGDLETSPLLCVERNNMIVPCVKLGYWCGKVDNVLVYYICLPGKCRSFEVCENYHGYYRLPHKDTLCDNNLSGPLCSQCSDDDHALSYSGYRCLPCSVGKRVGLILSILTSCGLVVAILICIIKCNVHVSTAGLYSFLYFYSVLPLFLWGRTPTGLQAVLSAIYSFTSLDFQFLKFLDLCLFDQAIYYEVIQYAYPMVILLLVQGIIKLDQCIPRRWQFFSGNSAVQGLCIILLLSYTSVSNTSLNILLPIMYQSAIDSEGSSLGTYVYVDPGVPYLDITRHLPYWLLALLVEVLLVVPFAVFMVIAPWTMKFIMSARVKHVVMEYQSCFQDRHRWFAGIYLIARQLLFLVTAVSYTPEMKAYLQQMVSASLLILMASVQPYNNWLFNLVDILILFLLTVISFSGYNLTAIQLFHNANFHNSVIGILSLLPCLCVLLACIIAALYKVYKCIQRRKYDGQLNSVIDEYSILSPSVEQSIRASLRPPPTSRMDEDLPPRFYDEESNARNSDESTPLLRGDMGRSAHFSRIHRSPINNAKQFNTK